MRTRIALGVLLGTCLAGPSLFAQGQGTISDGAATYIIPTLHYDGSPATTFRGVGGTATTNHIFETSWWYRISGDASEKFFPVPTSPNFPPGTTYTITWTNVDGRNFDAQEVATVLNGGAPSGSVTFDLTVSNPGVAPITIDLFHMADFDVNGSTGDSAILVNPNDYIRITDSLGQTGEYRGIGASAFLVRPFATTPTDVQGLLSDGLLTNFDNTGLPFAAGDFTGGFQWPGLVVAPGGSTTVRAVIAVNTPATPVELTNFQIQ